MAVGPVPSPFKFGYYYDAEREQADRNEPQLYGGERHILLFGVNGAGKSTRILIENLVTLQNRSLVVFDMKGELAAQTHRARRRLGDVKIVNPYNVLNLGSDGYNPLALLDPDHDEFFDHAKELTVAMIESEGDKNQFFSQTARGWLCGGIMWEVVQAKREGRPPSLLKAREWCLQPDMFRTGADGKDVLVKGVSLNAQKMAAEGGRQIANLAARFVRYPLNRSDQDVLSTLATETEFLISNPIARDLEKGKWSFAQLKQRPTAVYIILPPNQVADKRRWTRMLMTAALCEHLRPGPMKTLFILDEFRVSIGHLQIVNDFWALVRGYGVQFLPVCQSVLQLRALFKDEWENYAGQAGIVATIGPPGDTATAEWMSKRSGNKTVWQEGWSEGEGTGGHGPTTNFGESRSQVERAFMLPQEIMSMKLGTGRIWPSGHGDTSIPYFAPNYWQRPELRGLIDPNPYFEGGAAAARPRPQQPTADSASPSNVVPLSRGRAKDRGRFQVVAGGAQPLIAERQFVQARVFNAVMTWLTKRHILLRLHRDPNAWIRWINKTNAWLLKPKAPPGLGRRIFDWTGRFVLLAAFLAIIGVLPSPRLLLIRMRPWVAAYAPPLLDYLPAPDPASRPYQPAAAFLRHRPPHQ